MELIQAAYRETKPEQTSVFAHASARALGPSCPRRAQYGRAAATQRKAPAREPGLAAFTPV